MSDDLRTFAETREELESDISFLDDVLGNSGKKGKGAKGKISESLSKIPKGFVDARKRIYGSPSGQKGPTPRRKSVRFGGLGEDIDEEEDGEEDNNASHSKTTEQKGRRELIPDGSGTDSSSEDEPEEPGAEELDTEQTRSNLYLMEAKAREKDTSELVQDKKPVFLPASALGDLGDDDEPLYVEPIDSILASTPSKTAFPVGKSRPRSVMSGTVENIEDLKPIWSNNQIDPTASTSIGRKLETIVISQNKWPGYGPFEDLLNESRDFELEFRTEQYSPHVCAKRKKEGSTGFIGTPDITGDIAEIKSLCLANMKMAMDERGNRDLLLVSRQDIAALQETVKGLVRQVQNLSLEQSVLKATVSDMYIILDRSHEGTDTDSPEESTIAFTKRDKTGRVTLDKVSSDNQLERDRIYAEMYTKINEHPVRAEPFRPNETNATRFTPKHDPASVSVLTELVETDAVSRKKKKFVKKIIGMAEDADTLRIIHESILNGRYK